MCRLKQLDEANGHTAIGLAGDDHTDTLEGARTGHVHTAAKQDIVRHWLQGSLENVSPSGVPQMKRTHESCRPLFRDSYCTYVLQAPSPFVYSCFSILQAEFSLTLEPLCCLQILILAVTRRDVVCSSAALTSLIYTVLLCLLPLHDTPIECLLVLYVCNLFAQYCSKISHRQLDKLTAVLPGQTLHRLCPVMRPIVMPQLHRLQ